MKTLYESLLDDEEDLIKDNSALLTLLPKFIESNYQVISNYKVHNNIVDTNNSIFLKKTSQIKSLTEHIFKFGKIDGMFLCSQGQLESLDGAPDYVNGIFDCSENNNLKSLKGSPKIVKGSFNCSFCPKLESLEGGPKSAFKDYLCLYCENLKSLKGSPKIVKGNFSCRGCNKLQNLIGLPKEMLTLNISQCLNLKDISEIAKVHIKNAIYIDEQLYLENKEFLDKFEFSILLNK